MKHRLIGALPVLTLLTPLLLLSCASQQRTGNPDVQIIFNAEEAEAALAIVRAEGAGAEPDSAMWQRLFSC